MRLYLSAAALALAGCSVPHRAERLTAVVDATAPAVVRVAYVTAEDAGAELPAPKTPEHPTSLPGLIALTLDRNPRLAQVGWAAEAARGRAVQAGLCPNPTLNLTGNELGDRAGPAGILSAYATQEIVTAGKLGLSQAAAFKEVDQATLNAVAERYRAVTEVRQAFFEAVTLQRRVEILGDLAALAAKSVENAEKLLKAKEGTRLDVVQLEVDLERYRAERESARRSLPAAYRRLAASVGVPDLPPRPLDGDLDAAPPDYDLDRVRAYVLGVHPEVRSAEAGVERARLLVKRAEAEPVPNLTVGAGYTRQSQNRSNDFDLGVSLPIPLWNKNQGNVLAARAQAGEAAAQVGRVRNDLVNRVAAAFGTYAAARERAERYRTAILPRAREAYQLSLKAYQGGQFESLRVLAAQRAVAEADLELVRTLGELWRAASEVAGLMLEDDWPPARKHP